MLVRRQKVDFSDQACSADRTWRPSQGTLAFASNVLRSTGVPPIEFVATIVSDSIQTADTNVSCMIPSIAGIGGQLILGNDVWRVEVTADGSIECVNDQGPCN